MKTLKQILNEIAQAYTKDELTFTQVLIEYKKGGCNYHLIQSIIDASMNIHVKELDEKILDLEETINQMRSDEINRR